MIHYFVVFFVSECKSTEIYLIWKEFSASFLLLFFKAPKLYVLTDFTTTTFRRADQGRFGTFSRDMAVITGKSSTFALG
jgi:hypothetical protein